MDKQAVAEQMEREIKVYGIDSWKWYCHTDPGHSGGGFQLEHSLAKGGFSGGGAAGHNPGLHAITWRGKGEPATRFALKDGFNPVGMSFI